MSGLGMGDPGLPPESVCAYIEDMLMELATLAETIGEPMLAPSICAAAAVAHQANLRRLEEARSRDNVRALKAG